MAFKDCDKVLPPSTFVSLPEDGDTAVMVFVGEPIPREEQFAGQKRYRYYFPVVTISGLQVWGVGSKQYRVMRDHWKEWLNRCFQIIRHGTSGSKDTTYESKAVKAPPFITKIKPKYTPKRIHSFMESVQAFGVEGAQNGEPPF